MNYRRATRNALAITLLLWLVFGLLMAVGAL